MSPENPYQGFEAATAQGRARLEDLRRQARDGLPPRPAELGEVCSQAQANARVLAAMLELDARPEDALDQAGLAAYEGALDLCLELSRFSLDLTRAHGPAYLAIPGVA